MKVPCSSDKTRSAQKYSNSAELTNVRIKNRTENAGPGHAKGKERKKHLAQKKGSDNIF